MKDSTLTTAYKHPIFDGTKKSEFKNWWENVVATLEMDDIEEYVTEEYKDVDMPDKDSADTEGKVGDDLATAIKDKRIRKEMKKAKAHMVRVSKGYPQRLALEASTPYKAYKALKEKYSVSQNRVDFCKLDKEWNEFTVTDASMDPDLIFETLDEHSKKLGEFGSRYEKDALQMISKLETALPEEEYGHVFQILNTDEEFRKSTIIQLATAKRMIKAHFNSNIKIDEDKQGSMMCMFIGNKEPGKVNDKANKIDKGSEKGNAYVCDFCGKKGHSAFRNGKPFCKKLISALNTNDNEKPKLEGKFWGKCFNCGKYGHSAKYCPELKKSETDEDINNLTIGLVEVTDKSVDIFNIENKNFVKMLGDTGAQGHVSPPGLEINKDQFCGYVKMANGVQAKVYQKEDVIIEDTQGNYLHLNERRIVEGIKHHIISLTQLMREGWILRSGCLDSKRVIYMSKNDATLTFEEDNRNLFYLKAKVVKTSIIESRVNPVVNLYETEDSKSNDVKNDLGTYPYNVFHDKFGHFGEARLRKMAKMKGFKLTGEIVPCDACGIVKSKAHPILKSSNPDSKATKVGERLYMDISGPFPLTSGRKHQPLKNKLYWYGIVDEFSGKMISSFHFKKNNLVTMFKEVVNYFKGRNCPVKFVRMDNAGENLEVERYCKEVNIVVEYTPPDTPQLNHMVERGFAIRWELAKVLMQNANLKNQVKKNKVIIVEAIKTASFLYEEGPRSGSLSTINELFFGDAGVDKVKVKHFIEWGRFGFVCNKRNKGTKMENRGTAMMMVGYALDHPSGTYRFYNPLTGKLITSNSVSWSKFNRWNVLTMDKELEKLKEVKQEEIIIRTSEDKELEEVADEMSFYDKNDRTIVPIEKNVIPSPVEFSNQRVTRGMSKKDETLKQQVYKEYDKATGKTLKVTGNIEPQPITLDSEVCHTCITSDPGEPTDWKLAFKGPEREWWIKSVTAEFNNFLTRKGWKFVPIEVAKQSGRRLVPTKLVFKKKDEIDGSIRFKSRCVTLGFMMVPGVDYTERFSPVATDEALKIQIGINLYFYDKGWETHSCDIEAAFFRANNG